GTLRPLQSTAVWPTGDAVDVTTWTVFVSNIPTVAAAANAAGRSGQLAGLSPGMATITALFGTSSATASVAVDATTADAVGVSAPSALPQGESVSLHAVAHFLDGSQVDVTRQASW